MLLLFEKQSFQCFLKNIGIKTNWNFCQNEIKKIPVQRGFFHLIYILNLHAKTFTTGTTAAGIGVIKIKTFSIKPITKFKSSIHEV